MPSLYKQHDCQAERWGNELRSQPLAVLPSLALHRQNEGTANPSDMIQVITSYIKLLQCVSKKTRHYIWRYSQDRQVTHYFGADSTVF